MGAFNDMKWLSIDSTGWPYDPSLLKDPWTNVRKLDCPECGGTKVHSSGPMRYRQCPAYIRWQSDYQREYQAEKRRQKLGLT